MFILTSNLRENHQKMYSPPEGKMISDINKVRTTFHLTGTAFLYIAILKKIDIEKKISIISTVSNYANEKM